MKRILTILVITITLTITLTLTTAAQTVRPLRVYLASGVVDKMALSSGSSMYHSRLDLDGVEHDDYVSLVVADGDGEHRYLLSQVDSLVMPNGRRVVFQGSMTVQPSEARLVTEDSDTYSGPHRSSFSGTFPGQGKDNVTFFWTENDRIRLDVGYESRASQLTTDKTGAQFVFDSADLDAASYTVYYPGKSVTVLSEQTQTGADNSDHIGPSGDCGTATAMLNDNDNGTYSFTLEHKAAYLCFLPHIDYLPSVRIDKIVLTCNNAIAGTYQLASGGLYNSSATSNTITLNLVPQKEKDFFLGHSISTEQDSCAAYMVIAPQDASRSFTATYYLTDTLSHISKVYRQTFSFQPLANTVYPVTCNIRDTEFRTIDLGLSCNWSNVNVNATEPSLKGSDFDSEEEANAALLAQTIVTEWLMPDEDQKEEILEKCDWTWGTYNGKTGYLVTGAAAAKEYGTKLRIFIPSETHVAPAECLTQNYRPVEALMVDLGLPSKTKWAARNIGANSAEDYGYYYAWGEVETKTSYTSGNYKYGTQNLGDNFDISGTQNDAAVVNWGGIWRMPTSTEMYELMSSDNCQWTWSTINGVNGYIITGSSGNKIFLPAAGYMDGASSSWLGSGGVYLTSIQGGNTSSYAYTLAFTSSDKVIYASSEYNSIFSRYNPFAERRIGHSVRPVAAPNATTKDGMTFNISTDSTTWKLGDTMAHLYGTLSSTTPLTGTVKVGFVIGDSATVDTITARFKLQQEISILGSYSLSQPVFDNIGYWYRAFINTGDTIFYGKARHYGYEMVDLGLSVKWANMNIGSDIPADDGYYYAWGENEPKDDYSLATYQWYKDDRYYNLGDNFNIAATEQDVAHVKMGNAWRMPTYSEMDELKEKCTWTWSTQDNVSGYKVTGPNGNSIFMPASGYMNATTLNWYSSGGVYATSTQGGNNSGYAYTLAFTSSDRVIYASSEYNSIFSRYNPFAERRIGHSVRAVAVPNGNGEDGVVYNVLTDSVTWRWNDTQAILHGTLSSTTPIEEDVTVGFIIGMNDSITQATALETLSQTVSSTGRFQQTIPVHDNMGYWYRAYVETADTVYYGKARHYGLEMVDLGIGTLWANMNVDASTPEEYGGYYAWGETITKDDYSRDNYSGYISRLDQYVNMGDDFCISNTELDVAHVRMGNAWRMPTNAELTALKDQCTWTWTSQNNVNGFRVTGPNGNSIFLPAGGYKNGTSTPQLAYGCVYPSATQGGSFSGYAYTFAGNTGDRVIYNTSQYYSIFNRYDPFAERRIGHTVRAVASPNAITSDDVMNIRTDSATWKWNDTAATLHGTLSSTTRIDGVTVGFVIGANDSIVKATAHQVYSQTLNATGVFSQVVPVTNNMGYWYRAYVETADTICYGKALHFGLEMVDLGLSVKWANMNVGAAVPSDLGGFYTWGETSVKEIYTAENNYYGTATLGNNGNIQATNYDAAYVNMGTKWCMPTYTQISELKNQCTWTWTSENSVSGWRVKGSNGNSIFLPAGGYKSYEHYYFENTGGSYMTATQSGDASYCYVLDFTTSSVEIYSNADYYHIFGRYDGNALRYVGHSVRAVAVP